MKKNDFIEHQDIVRSLPDALRERFDASLIEIIGSLGLKRCNIIMDTIKEQVNTILYCEWWLVNHEPEFDWKPYGKNEIRAIRNNADCINEFIVRKITDKKTKETYYTISIEVISPEDRSISTVNFHEKYEDQKLAQNFAEFYDGVR